MKKQFSMVLAGACMLAASSAAQADFGANVSLTSDYRYRGISQSNEEVAVQGGIDWFNDAGFYASVWASNVDFFPTGSSLDDGASVEFDVWAGYAGAINDDLSYDATVYYYTYPGDDIDQDFAEIGLGLNYGSFRVGYWYADDYLGLGMNNQYLEANYTAALPNDFGLEFHVGSSFGEVYDDPSLLGLEEYIDYSVSLTKSVADFDLKLSYIDTDISDAYSIESGHLANQDTLVFTVKKAF